MVRCPNCGEHLALVPRRSSDGVSFLEIAAAAGAVCNVTANEVIGKTRQKRAARARHLAMWAMRHLGASYPEIGSAFKRDHSTAQYGVRRVDLDDDLRKQGNLVLSLIEEAGRG